MNETGGHMKTLDEAIANSRQRPSKLAERVGITYRQLRHIATGTSRPSLGTLQALARTLEMSNDEVLALLPRRKTEDALEKEVAPTQSLNRSLCHRQQR